MPGRIILALASFLAAAPVTATVYRWVDADGRIHFSDKPESLAAEQLAVRSEPTDPARVATEREAREQRAYAEAAEAEERARAAEEEQLSERQIEVRSNNCERAREHYQQMLQAQRPYQTTADGERRYLSAEEIESKREAARASVEKWCD